MPLSVAVALLVACAGDCDGDGVVRAAEVAAAVRAAFAPGGCAAADADGSGAVRANDLTRVALAHLTGCTAPAPTATPTGTAVPTPTATPDATPASTWITLPPLPQGARQEVGIAVLDGRVYVLGGFDLEGGGSREAEAYDVAAGTWARLAPLPGLRNHVGAAALHGAVYVVGGFAGSGFAPVADVYRYDPGAETWTPVAALPSARGALAAAARGDRLHAVGGTAAGGSVGAHAIYDALADAWTPAAPLPGARNHLAAVVLDDVLYVAGGRDDAFRNSAALHRYDPARDAWDTLAPMPTARSGLALAAIDGRLVALGGEVNNANPPTRVFPQVEVYVPTLDRWASLDPMPVPRHGIGAATVGDLVIVPGGATIAGFAATAHSDALRLLP